MFRLARGGAPIAAIVLALGVVLSTASGAFAHARFDWSDPPAGSALDGTPFVLRAYFTQELTSKSTLRVLDANGVQVDLGDGHVDLDDPNRKVMLVSLPVLPAGVYSVEFSAVSAEDGHAEPGTFAFGVGMAPSAADPAPPAPPTGEQPAWPPADQPEAGAVLDAY